MAVALAVSGLRDPPVTPKVEKPGLAFAPGCAGAAVPGLETPLRPGSGAGLWSAPRCPSAWAQGGSGSSGARCIPD